jgi:hypothetical protein
MASISAGMGLDHPTDLPLSASVGSPLDSLSSSSTPSVWDHDYLNKVNPASEASIKSAVD